MPNTDAPRVLKGAMRLLAVLFLVFGLARSAVCDDVFLELARGVDPHDPAARAAARARLAAEVPDAWESPLLPGSLRAALAEDLTRAEAEALFARASRDPDPRAERWAALARNLSSRADAADLLLAVGARDVLAPTDAKALVIPALRALEAGDARLATELLRDARSVVVTAEELLDAPQDDGYRLVVDATTGAVELPVEARARLATVRPDLENPRPERALGAERVRALGRTAAEAADPARRLLAARLLHRAAEPGTAAAAVQAYASARSSLVDPDEWERLGATFGTLEEGASLPASERFALLKGGVYLSHVRAWMDADRAEAMASSLRRVLRSDADPRFRAAVVRLLSWFDYAFVHPLVEHDGPQRAVPSFLRLLDDLEAGREEDPVELRELGRRVARAVRSDTGGEVERRPDQMRDAAWPEGSDPSAETIRDWIRRDPKVLVDPGVNAWILYHRLPWVDDVPRATLEGLLDAPPSRVRVPGRAAWMDDGVGCESRIRLLRMLAYSAMNRDLLLDDRRASAWPAAVRRARGGILHEVGAGPTDDDATAAGWMESAVLVPRPADLPIVVEILAGSSRPGARALLLDAYEYGPAETLDGRPDGKEWPETPVVLDPAQRTRLVEVIRNAADPSAAFLAARLLGISATGADIEALLLHGAALDIGTTRHSHPLCDLAEAVNDASTLEIALAQMEKPEVPLRARRALFEDLWSLLDYDETRPLWERVLAWALDRGPLLDGDLPEAVLSTVLKGADTEEQETRLREGVLRALERVPVEEVRIRLRDRM